MKKVKKYQKVCSCFGRKKEKITQNVMSNIVKLTINRKNTSPLVIEEKVNMHKRSS